MGRLRNRVAGLEAHAHSTMSGADELLRLAKDLIEDLQDGIHFNLEVMGRKLHITLTLDPREEEDMHDPPRTH